nr:zinc finger, CCHC-type [Tanacetum cinerariifolium]
MVKVTGKKQHTQVLHMLEEHLKRDCPRYDSADVIMAMSVEEILDWIVDSGGSYHITYRRDYFVDFEEYDDGKILLVDGRECRTRRTCKSGKMKVIKGSLVGLSGTKRANRVYTLDGQAVTRKTLKGRKQLEDTTMSIYLVNRSPSSAIGFKKPVDMLAFFGWLASIKQEMLEPVKVKNMGFNESGLYKKIFISYGVGKGPVQVLQGVEFEVEPQEDHTSEVEPYGNVDHVVGLHEVQTQDLIYYHSTCDREQHSLWELFSYRDDINKAAFAVVVADNIYAHESLNFNNTIACDVISKWKDGLKDDIDARSDVYVLSSSCRKCSFDHDDYYWEYTPGMFIHLLLYIDDMVSSCGCKAEIWATKGLLDKAKGNVLGMKIVRDQSECNFSQDIGLVADDEGGISDEKDFHISAHIGLQKCVGLFDAMEFVPLFNGPNYYLLVELGARTDQEYLMVYMRVDIASEDLDMLDKFDRGLQTDVHVFVDFDYAIGRLITVMGSSITRGYKGAYLANGTRNRVKIQAKDSTGYCYRCLVKGYP